jgi:hypothetical protein
MDGYLDSGVIFKKCVMMMHLVNILYLTSNHKLLIFTKISSPLNIQCKVNSLFELLGIKVQLVFCYLVNLTELF